MSVFAIEINKDPNAYNFVVETNERLGVNDDIAKNPFYGRAFIQSCNGKTYAVFSMTPIYPRAYIGGYFIIVPALVFSGFKWTGWYIPGIILLSFGFFWSKYFYYLMALVGFKKKGYKGPRRLLSTRDLMEVLIG